MSPSRERAQPLLSPSGSAGKLKADGRRIYRMAPPQIIWWGWVGLLVFSLGDLLIQGHDKVSLQFALGALTATGLVYACTLWSRVIADDDGITVLNPFRRFDVPWGAVAGIFLADSVEVQCVRGPEKKDKTVYCWALSAPRRARARAQLRARQWEQGRRSRPAGYERLPSSAREMTKMLPAEAIARELAGLSEQVKAASGGAAAGADGAAAAGRAFPQAVMSARWAWLPLAAVFVPGIAFALSEFVR